VGRVRGLCVVWHSDVFGSSYVSGAIPYDVMVTVQPLQTGYTKDVSGKILVELAGVGGSLASVPPTSAQYKLLDASVRVFRAGEGVL
jgi:hypothetical protein